MHPVSHHNRPDLFTHMYPHNQKHSTIQTHTFIHSDTLIHTIRNIHPFTQTHKQKHPPIHTHNQNHSPIQTHTFIKDYSEEGWAASCVIREVVLEGSSSPEPRPLLTGSQVSRELWRQRAGRARLPLCSLPLYASPPMSSIGIQAPLIDRQSGFREPITEKMSLLVRNTEEAGVRLKHIFSQFNHKQLMNVQSISNKQQSICSDKLTLFLVIFFCSILCVHLTAFRVDLVFRVQDLLMKSEWPGHNKGVR